MTQLATADAVKTAVRRPRIRGILHGRTIPILVGIVAILIIMGLTATLSASSTLAINSTIKEGEIDRFLYFRQQLRGVGLGVVLMWITSRISYKAYKHIAIPLYLTAIGLLVLVLATGRTVGGSRAWFRFGNLSFQPSEFAKFAVIVALATVLERKRRSLDDFSQFAGLVVIYLGVVCLLVMKQPDLGTVIVITGAAMGVLFTSAAPISFVGLTASVAMVGGMILAKANSTRFARIISFRNPWADPLGDGYQAIQSMYALANGGLTGVGLGASRARWFYLPGAHTDFIFAIFGEEAGFLGAMSVIVLFVVFSMIGWSIAMRARDAFGRMLAAGITSWICVQAIVNIGGVIGALPITGIPLPFMSFGSTAVMMAMGATGVLINISRSSPDFKAVAVPVTVKRTPDSGPPESRRGRVNAKASTRVSGTTRKSVPAHTPHPNRGKASAERRRAARAVRR